MRDRWRQRFLENYAGLVPPGRRGQVDVTHPGRRAHARADEKAIGYVPYRKSELPDPLPATLVAFYLPQFHPIAENDEWWGKGFTEWRNVTRALPQFEGHAQPRLPGDLGFYDLRDPEVMREQARLAREYGIGAFCFYFYWFGGRTLLEQPLRNWLADRSIDLPFCLCWANESWSRRWDGRGDQILIRQEHGSEDDMNFIVHVAEYLRDPRYLRVDGKPLLLVYRPNLFPDCAATIKRWRKWCRQHGVGEIHLAYVQSFESPHPASIGFDATVEFPPNRTTGENITADQRLLNPDFKGQVLDWRVMAKQHARRERPPYRLYSGINVGWDNEPRRPGAGRSYAHSSPRGYRDWLQTLLDKVPEAGTAGKNLIFINAWNEWAEGAVLEPDCSLGYAWLERTRQALQGWARPDGATQVGTHPVPTVVVHAWHEQEFDEILGALQSTGTDWRIVVTTGPDRAETMAQLLANRDLQAEIHTSENRGRDILPFLRIAELLLEEGVGPVLKLHTKRSAHLKDGDQWRRDMVEQLLDRPNVAAALASFTEETRLGLVIPQGHLLDLTDYMGANSQSLGYLHARTGIRQAAALAASFPSGSMYWVRLESLRPLLDAHLKPDDFEPETGQNDGTLAHAIERFMCICVEAAGFRISQTNGTAAPQLGKQPYPYATPSVRRRRQI